MPRSSWKGYLRLSLVSCAVVLYNATSTSERVSFNTLHRKTGNRLKQLMIDSVTEEPVDPADRVKGYQVSKGQYVMVEDADLEALKIESTKLIEIETFVPQSEIDQIYLDGAYYLAPDDRVAEEAFAVIRDAMAHKKVVGIGRIVLNRRERMLMLQPRDNGIMATTLRFPYEVRQDKEYFADITEVKLPAEMLEIAEVIIDRKSGHFEPATFTDRYEEAVVNLLKAKQAGQVFSVPEAPEPTNVVNIMDALKRSLEAEGADANDVRRPRAPSKKPAAVEKKPAAAEKKVAAGAETIRKPKARKAAR
ncbi:Ku protein [Reyranella sp. CPCC 100927]|uniref:non-homologous end joining protein Ku n=1 Tax=Reyranella sp. CPCC 100927 TaxID=2599616 RepID=UPI0011B43829|nr:Ku protein [Reyranella sp. CPCC 100927]TWT11470.1 Ku protein [Reyranella sp. CPCC 100927]